MVPIHPPPPLVQKPLQGQAEEALLNASVLETPLCAAVLLEVSANRCREAGRLRRAAFRLIQVPALNAQRTSAVRGCFFAPRGCGFVRLPLERDLGWLRLYFNAIPGCFLLKLLVFAQRR